MRGAAFDVLHADPPGRGVVVGFQRQLLQLAQQPLLALSDLRDERLGGGGVERQAEARGLLARPLGELPRLDGQLRDDLSAGALDGVVQRGGCLRAGLLAREQRERGVGRHLRDGRGEVLLDVVLAPALDPFDDDHAPPDRERHRGERVGDAGGRGGLAFEQLDARASPLLAFAERPQPRPPLGDGAVVVAVDQVGGPQVGHRPSLCAAPLEDRPL